MSSMTVRSDPHLVSPPANIACGTARKGRAQARGHPSVTDLVTRARNGDEQAWAGLVERYSPLIWSICRRHGLGADAADVGQVVWQRLVSQLGNLRDPAALPGWIATTTRRECYRAPRAAGQVLDLENTPDTQAAEIEDELLLAERDAALRAAFADLPPRGQALLSLLMADPPMSYTEISAALGIRIGSIGPTRQRCLERIRRHPAIASLISADAASDGAACP